MIDIEGIEKTEAAIKAEQTPPLPVAPARVGVQLKSNTDAIFGNYEFQVSEKSADQIKDSMNAIADALPTKNIKLDNLPIQERGRRYFGAIEFDRNTGNPNRIMINKLGNHKELTFAHEIGHQIDFTIIRKEFGGLKGYRIFTGRRELTSKSRHLMDVIKKTPEAQALLTGTAVNREGLLISPSGARYMSTDHEFFARAFSQYVARKTKNKKMLEQIKTIRKIQPSDLWADENFDAIEKAMDDFLKAEGK